MESLFEGRFIREQLLESPGHFSEDLRQFGVISPFTQTDLWQRLLLDDIAYFGQIVLVDHIILSPAFFVCGVKTPGDHVPCTREPLIDSVIAAESVAGCYVHDIGRYMPYLIECGFQM